MKNIIEIDTSNIVIGDLGDSLYAVRNKIASLQLKKYHSEVTVFLQAYNNIEKTKRCVESLLKYTSNVDCDLILVDNGSTDDTLEYFKSIDFPKLSIIHINENKGGMIPQLLLSSNLFSEYVVMVAGDLILTENWLSNLLKVAHSDSQIGIVNPMSSNTSNLQDPGLNFANYSEMHEKAAVFNVSDPRKWEERLRIITLGTLIKKECLFATGVPFDDVGFAHNFADDDLAFRVRRAGYKVVLAGDTWIHHDDVKTDLPFEKAKKINDDLIIGRENFREKYFGIDAWDDVNNFIPEYLSALKAADGADHASVLGIDVRCGTPVLEIKNGLRKFNIFDTDCYAYTTDAKYMIDLQTVCGAANVLSGSINGFSEHFEPCSFDYIVIGNDINTYPEPYRLIRTAYSLLRPGGQLFISLQNTNNIFSFAYSIGRTHIHDTSHAINYTVEEFLSSLMQTGYDAAYVAARGFDAGAISQDLLSNVSDCLCKLPIKDRNETMFRLTSHFYYFVINAK